MQDLKQTNKDALQNLMRAIAGRNVEGVKACITDDMELITMGSSIISGKRARDEFLELVGFLANILQPGMELRFISMTSEDDRVSCEMEGYGKLTNGTRYENLYHFLAYVRDGKVCRLKEYIDTKYTDIVLGPLLQSPPDSTPKA